MSNCSFNFLRTLTYVFSPCKEIELFKQGSPVWTTGSNNQCQKKLAFKKLVSSLNCTGKEIFGDIYCVCGTKVWSLMEGFSTTEQTFTHSEEELSYNLHEAIHYESCSSKKEAKNIKSSVILTKSLWGLTSLASANKNLTNKQLKHKAEAVEVYMAFSTCEYVGNLDTKTQMSKSWKNKLHFLWLPFDCSVRKYLCCSESSFHNMTEVVKHTGRGDKCAFFHRRSKRWLDDAERQEVWTHLSTTEGRADVLNNSPSQILL